MNSFYDEGINFLIESHSGHSVLNNQHFHDLYEIYYLEKGRSDYFIDNNIYSAKEGDIIVIPPSTIHKTISNDHLHRKRLLIYLDKQFVNTFVQDKSFFQNVTIFHTTKKERINAIFFELLSEYNGHRNEAMIKALLCELIILLERKGKTTDNITEDSMCSKRISEVINYINEEYASDITLDSVSKHFFINPSYLSRLFKKCTGLSFSNYIQKYRIKKAIELMSTTDKKITEIAFDVGFNSINHFCKAFKSVMDISPLKYKNSRLK